MGWSLDNEKQMRNVPIDKNLPTLSYIVNNWPKTTPILKKYVVSNCKKPDLFKLSLICLNELQVFKTQSLKAILKKISKKCSQNFVSNTYHDQHHFKTVLVLSCLLAKLINLNSSDRLFLVFIALAHDVNHQGRRVLSKPFYQEEKSCMDLHRIFFKKVLSNKKWNRIHRIFRSTYFPIKPKNVNDNLEKIILDADILASLIFGMDTGIEFARRLKHEIRFKNESWKLFEGFLKVLNNKSLYLQCSKDSC